MEEMNTEEETIARFEELLDAFEETCFAWMRKYLPRRPRIEKLPNGRYIKVEIYLSGCVHPHFSKQGTPEHVANELEAFFSGSL